MASWLRLRGETLLHVEDGSVRVEMLAGGGGALPIVERLATVMLAPSGRFAVTWEGTPPHPRAWRLPDLVELAAPVATLPNTAGLVEIDGIPRLVTVARDRVIATAVTDASRLEARLRPFGDLRPHAAVGLGGNAVALLGRFGGDPYIALETVVLGEGEPGPAVQHAPTDRAWQLGVGPGPDETAVVYREPEALDESEPDALPPCSLYIVDRATGAVREAVERQPVGGAGAVCATAKHIAVQQQGAVVRIERNSRRECRTTGAAVALDPYRARYVVIDTNGGRRIADVDDE